MDTARLRHIFRNIIDVIHRIGYIGNTIVTLAFLAGLLIALWQFIDPFRLILSGSEKELIKNGHFEDSYHPAWTAQINDGNVSIKQSENFVSISLNGEGMDSKAVEFHQVIIVPDPTDLSFYMRIKISDLNNDGFPVGALTFMDHIDGKVFQITFTPDKHYESSSNDYLYPIRNEQIEEITISSLLEYARKKRLPLEAYKKITQAKVSFYIAVPSGYRCRRCTIEVHNVSLKYGKRRIIE